MTSFAPALKTLYTERTIRNMVYKNQPWLAMMPKFERFTGDMRKLPNVYGGPQNASTVFSVANAENSTSSLAAFYILRKKNYSIGEIDYQTIRASENSEGAFMEAATLEVNNALNTLARSLGIQMWRNGTGSIGQLSSTSGTGLTLTLADPEASVNFEVNMCLEANATDSNPVTATTTGNQGKIASIDRINGVITLQAAIPGLATSWYLFPRGNGSGQTTINGMQAWVPFLRSGLSTPFNGVVRSTDATRLAGQYFDGSAYSIEEAIQYLLRYIVREGGRPDYVFLNPLQMQNLIISLGSKVQYVNVNAKDADVGFKGVQIYGAGVDCTVLTDMNVPNGYGWAVQSDTWEFASLGNLVNLFDGDGLELIRSQQNDSLQFRCYSYSEMGCYAPGYNGVVKLPTSP